MTDAELSEIYRKAAYGAYARLGSWIGRTMSLMATWALTYLLMIAAFAFPQWSWWMVYLIPAPALFHLVAEPIFIKIEEKAFGKVEDTE